MGKQTSSDNYPYWVDRRGVPHLNFGWAERHYARLSEEALRFSISDCRSAIAAMPENPKNGLYEDTIHVIGMILSGRSRGVT